MKMTTNANVVVACTVLWNFILDFDGEEQPIAFDEGDMNIIENENVDGGDIIILDHDTDTTKRTTLINTYFTNIVTDINEI